MLVRSKASRKIVFSVLQTTAQQHLPSLLGKLNFSQVQSNLQERFPCRSTDRASEFKSMDKAKAVLRELDDANAKTAKLFNHIFIRHLSMLRSSTSGKLISSINIRDLSKEDVILALFKNAYEKSEEAKAAKINIMRLTPNEPGIYSEPFSFEISEILRHNKRIDYLGCVKLSMDFSGDVIDTDLYDKLHKPGTNGVESAAAVIKKLRGEKFIEESKFSATAAQRRIRF